MIYEQNNHKYVGISFNRKTKKWKITKFLQVNVNQIPKTYYLGKYDKVEIAATMFDVSSISFKCTNFRKIDTNIKFLS